MAVVWVPTNHFSHTNFKMVTKFETLVSSQKTQNQCSQPNHECWNTSALVGLWVTTMQP